MIHISRDQQIANEYWADKEYKKWVVQLSSRSDVQTVYVRARTYKLARIPNWQTLTGNRSGEFPRLKDEIARIVRPGGQVLSFGWSSVGMGSGRGFSKTHIKLVCHGGGSRDTICMREVKDF